MLTRLTKRITTTSPSIYNYYKEDFFAYPNLSVEIVLLMNNSQVQLLVL